MGSKTSTLAVERTVIEAVKKEPQTMYALADNTGFGYYTIRRVVNGLVERNVLRPEGHIERSTIYCYVGDETEHDYIPMITDLIARKQLKAIGLLSAVGNEDSLKSVLASKRLPKHVAELLYLALQGEQGLPLREQMDNLRERITKDYLYAKNNINFYEQLLQDPRWWDEQMLTKMVNDEDFSAEQVLHAHDYYKTTEW